ncbi:MAG: VWA domain-containing protein [Parcubacteria group bacterium]|nr:VWA domain-containing protein [Parcubacteria group bacterium]
MNELVALLLPCDCVIFRHSERLWIIAGAAFFFAALFAIKYRAAKRALKSAWIQEHVSVSKIPSPRAYIAAWFFLLIAVTLIAGVWAEADWRVAEKEPVYGSVRVTFLLDSSLSMVYASDVSPSRLAVAKEVLASFIEELTQKDPVLRGQYQFALIPFAAAALPFYSSFITNPEEFSWLLLNVDEKTITRQGTSLLAALRAYQALLARSPVAGPAAIDVAVVISDGGKEEGIQSERNPISEILRTLPPQVIMVTVGVGAKGRDDACVARLKGEGGADSARVNALCFKTKPVLLMKKDKDGRFGEYLREKEGDPKSAVLASELDESMLAFIATPTKDDTPFSKRNYHFFADKKELLGSLKRIVTTYRIQEGVTTRYRYVPIVSWFLFPAFLILYFLFGFGGWALHTASLLYSRSRRV